MTTRAGRAAHRFSCRGIVFAFALLLPFAASRAHAHPAPHAGGQHSQGYLGIEFHDVTPDQAAVLHLRPQTGVEVVMVDHDGPAGQSGLRQHDIIVALNAHAVEGASALRRMIHEAGAGMAITLSVLRGGQPLTIHARLADRDEVLRDAMQRLAASDDAPPPAAEGSAFMAAQPDPPAPQMSRTQSFLNAMLHTGPFTGLGLQSMEPQLADFFGAPGGTGLLVDTVVPDSPAAAAGLSAGDVVLRADGVPLHAVNDWTRHLRDVRGRAVVLTVLHGHQQQTLTLVPDLKHRSALELPRINRSPAAAPVRA